MRSHEAAKKPSNMLGPLELWPKGEEVPSGPEGDAPPLLPDAPAGGDREVGCQLYLFFYGN